MKSKKIIEKILTVLLTFSMMTPNLVTNAADDVSVKKQESDSNNSQIVNSLSYDLENGNYNDHSSDMAKMDNEYAETDEVTIVVELSDNLLMRSGDTRRADNSISTFDSTNVGSLQLEHEKVKSEILSLAGENSEKNTKKNSNNAKSKDTSQIQFGYDYYRVLNGFSVKTQYKYLSRIKELNGVSNAFVAQKYEMELPQDTTDDSVSGSLDMVGANEAAQNGYSGKGVVVAVLDSGLDVKHEAFTTNMPPEQKYKKDDINKIISESSLSAKKTPIDKVYINDKVPYVYDYADYDNDVDPGDRYDGEHGTHVSGIAAGNCDKLKGTAPDAQLMMMKVFSDTDGSTSDDVLIAALDDSVKLGADVINMSLGASCGFSSSSNEAMQKVYAKVKDAGINLAISAGNSNNAAVGNCSGVDLPYAEDPDYGVLGSPSTFNNAMSVASMVNTEVKDTAYFVVNNKKIYVMDTSGINDPKIGSLEGIHPYVYCGNGTDKDFKTAGYVKGKVALISKAGDLDFKQKIDNASSAGAIAAIIFNDQAGITSLYTDSYPIPAVVITKKDGEYLRDQVNREAQFSKQYYGSTKNPDGYKMSAYSAWGPTPDLKLKPEITAPGENIYSSVLRNNYALMSGTSMASPSVAGLFASVKQYVHSAYPNLNTKETYDLVNALLMSTASPAKDENGEFYTPRKQGAGLANSMDAIDSKAYVSVADSDKPKAELGYNTDGSFSFTATIHNMSNNIIKYKPDTSALIEEVTKDGFFSQHSKNRTGNGIDVTYSSTDEQGKISVPANGSIDVNVTITLTDELKSELLQKCPKGNYVDGFLRFDNEEGVDLTVPFLGFYGDWAKPDVFDKSRFDDYHIMGCVPYNAVDGRIDFLGQNMIYRMVSGKAKVNKERYAISSQSYGNMCSLLATQLGLLRNAKKLSYIVKNKETGKVVKKSDYDDVRKSYQYSLGTITWAEAFLNPVPTFNGFDDNNGEVPEGQYTYTVSALVDGTNGKYQDWSFDFAYDKTAPKLKNYEVYKEDGNTFVKVVMTDNHFLSGCQVKYDDQNAMQPYVANDPDKDNGGNIVIDESGNKVYTTTIDVTPLLNKMKDENIDVKNLKIDLYDYAMNRDTVDIPVKEVEADGINLENENLDMVVGMKRKIPVTFTPEDVSDKSLNWTSSDDSVAAVNEDGLITAVGEGIADITAETKNGVTASCKVNVSKNEGIVLNPSEISIITGDEAQIEAVIADELGDLDDIAWSSSDDEIASVSEKGLVKSHKYGTVMITAELKSDPNIKAECTVKIEDKQYPGLTIEKGVLTSYTASEQSSLTIPDGVTEIASSVFSGNTNLREVTIPSSVKVIGDYAFSNCSSLEKVTFTGDGLENIGQYAFYYNTELKTINIPSTVSDIGERAFYWCSKLNHIVIPNGVSEVHVGTFFYCGELTDITLPDGLKVIDDSAFFQTGLSDLKIPDTVEKIGVTALANNNFKEITLPQSCTSIGDNALQACTSLVKVNIDENLESMGNKVFQACTRLKNINITKNVSSIGLCPFYLCSSLEKIEVDDKNENYSSEDGVLYNKDKSTLIEYPLGKSVFTFTLPDTVKKISKLAFSNSEILTNITLNDGLEEIEQNAFEKCSELTEISLPDSVTNMGERTFYNCTSLKYVNIGSGLKVIETETFREDPVLSDVKIGDSVEKICANAFYTTGGLENLEIPDSVKEIEYCAFTSCKDLKHVKIGKGLEKLDDGVFSCDPELKDFTVNPNSSSFVSVDGVLFSKDMEKLVLYPTGKEDKEYFIPEGVKTVGYSAFNSAGNLVEVTLPDTVTTIDDYAFNYCQLLNKVNFSDNLEIIGDSAFCSTNLKELELPSKIKTIKWGAFSTITNLTYVDITKCESVALDYCVFSGCENIKTFIAGDNVTDVGFFSIPINENITIYAPKDSKVAQYAHDNNLNLVEYDGLTVVATPDKSKVKVGNDISFTITTLGAKGEVTYKYSIKDRISGNEAASGTADSKIVKFTPESAGSYEFTIYAEDETNTTVQGTARFTVTDEKDTSINWNYGKYSTTAHLYDLNSDNLLSEDSMLGKVELNVAEDESITADIGITGMDNVQYFNGEEYVDAETIRDDDNKITNVAIKLIDQNPTVFVKITYGGKTIIGRLNIDFAGAKYAPIPQQEYKFVDGKYSVKGKFYRSDWDEESLASAFIKDIYVDVDGDKFTVTVNTQPWNTDEGIKILNVLKILGEDGYEDVQVKDRDENGKPISFTFILPKNVKFSDVILGYDGEEKAARLYLDFENAQFIEGKPKPSVKVDKVTGLKADDNTTSSLTIKWNEVENADGYEIEKYNAKTEKYDLIKSVDAQTLSYKQISLIAGDTYAYRVRAYRVADGEKQYGDYSDVLNTTTLPEKVNKISAEKTKEGIKLEWEKVNGASGYEIYESLSKDDSYKLVKTIEDGSETSFVFETKSEDRYYKIRAYKILDNIKYYGDYSKAYKVEGDSAGSSGDSQNPGGNTGDNGDSQNPGGSTGGNDDSQTPGGNAGDNGDSQKTDGNSENNDYNDHKADSGQGSKNNNSNKDKENDDGYETVNNKNVNDKKQSVKTSSPGLIGLLLALVLSLIGMIWTVLNRRKTNF